VDSSISVCLSGFFHDSGQLWHSFCMEGSRALDPGHELRDGILAFAVLLPEPAGIFSKKTMAFDSSTLCARTTSGEAELATPRQGLSLGQRRVLTLLQNPAAVDEVAQKHGLEPDKLARDLTRLAELRLIVLQGPTISPVPANVPSVPRTGFAESMAAVVIGQGSPKRPTLFLAAGAVTFVLAAGVWYGNRTTETASANSPPIASPPIVNPPAVAAPVALATATAPPTPANIAADASPSTTLPVTSTVLRGPAPPLEVRPEIRPGLIITGPVPPKPDATPHAPDPKAAPIPEHPAASATPSPVAPIPAAAPAPTPASEPLVKGNPVAEPLPPTQLAMAAVPASAAPRPALATELKAVSRDPPDFPREAIMAGVKSGVVNARIHVDASGKVSAVDILGGQPSHVFDRAVRNALSRWQFEPMAAGRTSDVDVNFQRD
jgi:protein TonB